MSEFDPENIEYAEIAVQVQRETDKAIMFLNDALKPVWLPKSQIIIEWDAENCATIKVPEWLVEDKELEGESCIS